MKSRVVAPALLFSPFLLLAGVPGVIGACCVWFVGAVWIVRSAFLALHTTN